jgi:phosphopantothenoylcysteine decarboxylase/phosphopantothenate--cysteine ligase
VATQKNKADDTLVIELETKRYFSFIRKIKKNQFFGFALETENEIENAKVKSRKKLRFDRFKFFKR